MRPWLWSTSVIVSILINSVVIRTSYESAPCKLTKCYVSLLTYSSMVSVSCCLNSCIDTQIELITISQKRTLSPFHGSPQHTRPWLWSTSVTVSILITTLWIRTTYGRAPFQYKSYTSAWPLILHWLFSHILSPVVLIHSYSWFTTSTDGPYLHLTGLPNTSDRDYRRH